MQGHAYQPAGQYQPAIQHFSHQHPLHLSNLHESQAPTTCASCRLIPSGWTYACAACNYYLHATCAQLPKFVTHPAHPTHPLDLLPVPAYADGCFQCDACGGAGTGFSYHCGACGIDFHPFCTSAPRSVTHKDHPHPLALTFSLPPHYIMGFTCDVCRGKGSNCWLYRCATCEFDVHMRCATGGEKQPLQAGKTLAQLLSSRRGDGSYGGSSSPLHRGGSAAEIGGAFGDGGSSDDSSY